MPDKNSTAESLYADKLVKITRDSLILHNYYFFGLDKTIPFEKIAGIMVNQPSVSTGKWRIWGSGGPGAWLPFDWHRPSRDRIFHVRFKNTSFITGFTVENSAVVENILRQAGLIKS